MQRHHQRPGSVGGVVFRHIERKAAAVAGLVVVMDDPTGFARLLRQAGEQIGVVANILVDEEAVDRWQFCPKRIKSLLRAGEITQRAKHRDQVAIAKLHGAQTVERRKHIIACTLQPSLNVCELLRPAGQPGTRYFQGFIRLTRGFHDLIEIGRIQMSRDEAERFKRLQQRRQHGNDIIQNGLAHVDGCSSVARCKRERNISQWFANVAPQVGYEC